MFESCDGCIHVTKSNHEYPCKECCSMRYLYVDGEEVADRLEELKQENKKLSDVVKNIDRLLKELGINE